MSVLKAVIIEDEFDSRENLKNLLGKYCSDLIEVIAEGESVQQGLEIINSDLEFDVMFLDIRLKDGLSFQMLEQAEEIDFEVIFATAYNRFAVDAFKYSAVGYLLKPINPDDLVDTVNKLSKTKPRMMKKRLDILNQNYNKPNAFEKMCIYATDGIYFVNIKDIIRCEGEDNYTHVFVSGKEGKTQRITISKTIKEYETLLTPMNFYRVHKSHLVNMNYIERFIKGDGGYLVMEDGMKIDVSRRRRALFMETLKQLQLTA